jgi:hypothetical protein
MSMADPYFIPFESAPFDLGVWSKLAEYTPLGLNCFGEIFLRDEVGKVFFFDISENKLEKIAENEDEFHDRLIEDSDGWLLRPLVDACRDVNLRPETGECYAFRIPPVLGGAYDCDNIWVARISEWHAFMRDMCMQIKDYPDGTTIELRIVD